MLPHILSNGGPLPALHPKSSELFAAGIDPGAAGRACRRSRMSLGRPLIWIKVVVGDCPNMSVERANVPNPPIPLTRSAHWIPGVAHDRRRGPSFLEWAATGRHPGERSIDRDVLNWPSARCAPRDAPAGNAAGP
jgi:hypothetical protein